RCHSGGYSESVARILVDHWITLPRLAQLARNDNEFRHFVIKHVDETLNGDDVDTIRSNAKNVCPIGLHHLCDDLIKKSPRQWSMSDNAVHNSYNHDDNLGHRQLA